MAEHALEENNVDVTVVVPCYNTERFLGAALTSAEQNNRCNLEILVLNDGSTDGSLAIMQEHAAKDSRVRVIDKQNQGYGATVNRGIAEARGIYVAILEPDDWVDPHMYDDLIDFARTFSAKLDPNTAPDIVKTPYWRIVGSGTGKEERLNCIAYGRVHPKAQPFTIADAPRIIRHHPSIWSALYRKSFLKEKGISFMEVPGAAWVDTPFAWDTMCAAERIVYLEKPYYCYREDLPGTSSNRRLGSLSFERWGNMADVVEARDITDRTVLESLYYAGFRYIAASRREGSIEDADVEPLLDAMCKRMNPEIVAGMGDVAPSMRAFVLERAGHAVPKMSSLPYYASLAEEFFHSLKTNGPAYAFSRIKLAFK